MSTPQSSSPTRGGLSTNASAALAVPLLNLDGPPPNTGRIDDHNVPLGGSTRKKAEKAEEKEEPQ